MAKKPPNRNRITRSFKRAECESVHFAEIEFPKTLAPRLVIQFSEGLSVLVEDQSSIGLAAEFIAAFRESEKKGARQ